jgi:addiction module antitoxin, RelB/DinJ family
MNVEILHLKKYWFNRRKKCFARCEGSVCKRDSFEADQGTDLKKCIALVRTLTYNMDKRKGRDDMAAKSANLYARIEPDVKEQAEGILATLGIPASNAINMFYKQIILNRGLPFEVKIPTARPVDISRMNAETLDMELEKGYADMQAGRTKSAAQVFADIRRDYNV